MGKQKKMGNTGEQAAAETGNEFATFFAKTQAQAVFFATQFLGNRQDAEDVVQETYLAVYKKLEAGTDCNFVLSDLFWYSLRNRCINLYNSRKREQSRTCDGEAVLPLVEEENSEFLPADALDSKEKRRMILHIVEQLPDEQRAAVMMRYFCGLTVAETARELQKAEGTVKAQLFAARKKLMNAVRNEEARGNLLHGAAAVPVLTQIFQEEAQGGGYCLAESVVASISETAKMALAGGAQTTSATTAGAVVAQSSGIAGTAMTATAAKTILGVGTMAKIAALSAGAKIAIATASAVAVIAGVGVPVYVYSQKEEIPVAALESVASEAEDHAAAVVSEDLTIPTTSKGSTTSDNSDDPDELSSEEIQASLQAEVDALMEEAEKANQQGKDLTKVVPETSSQPSTTSTQPTTSSTPSTGSSSAAGQGTPAASQPANNGTGGPPKNPDGSYNWKTGYVSRVTGVMNDYDNNGVPDDLEAQRTGIAKSREIQGEVHKYDSNGNRVS